MRRERLKPRSLEPSIAKHLLDPLNLPEDGNVFHSASERYTVLPMSKAPSEETPRKLRTSILILAFSLASAALAALGGGSLTRNGERICLQT